jgi:hypothetical protein
MRPFSALSRLGFFLPSAPRDLHRGRRILVTVSPAFQLAVFQLAVFLLPAFLWLAGPAWAQPTPAPASTPTSAPVALDLLALDAAADRAIVRLGNGALEEIGRDHVFDAPIVLDDGRADDDAIGYGARVVEIRAEGLILEVAIDDGPRRRIEAHLAVREPGAAHSRITLVDVRSETPLPTAPTIVGGIEGPVPSITVSETPSSRGASPPPDG